MEKILVVDDDRFFLDVCSDILVSEGYEVLTARSGEQALDILSRESVHLVITDLFMPGMSGLDFLSQVKRLDPSLDVIMVTGHADIESAVSALKNGARDYLMKPFNDDEFKHTVAVCIEQRRLLDENLELKELVSLFQIGQSLLNCIDLDRLYSIVTDSLRNELKSERVLGVFRGDDGFLLKEVRGIKGKPAEAVFAEMAKLLPETESPLVPMHLKGLSLETKPGIEELGLREALVFCVRGKGGAHGFLIHFNNPGETFPGFNVKRINFILDQAALAFENAVRFSSLNNLIYIDELTGLFNYRYLEIALERETKRVERYGSSVSVIFLDLDLFKQVNDQYGHLIGSRVLNEVGMLLKKSVREVDVVVRYGGDEYTLILSELGEKEASRVAERIRKTIQDHPFLGHDGYDIRLTASLGYACFPQDTKSKQQLLEMADQAMYRGKASGKNTVFHAMPK